MLPLSKKAEGFTLQAVNQIRTASRLPYEVTWVEFNHKAFAARERELTGDNIFEDYVLPLQEGWLFNRLPDDKNAFRLHLFRRCQSESGDVHLECPHACVVWRTDDRPFREILPEYESNRVIMARIALGLSGDIPGEIEGVSWATSELLKPPPNNQIDLASDNIGHLTGVLLRAWAFLATINDVPTTMTTARQQRGFTAKAKRHQYLEHKIVTLKVPTKHSVHSFARSIIAAVKRRAHTVRGHWRKDWRDPSKRIWVGEHMRGDISLGYVSHDYKVTA